MIRGVIFDLDGVLVDSAPAHAWAYCQLFAEQGVEFTARDFHEVAWGVPRADVIQRVLGQMDDVRLETLSERKASLVVEYL